MPRMRQLTAFAFSQPVLALAAAACLGGCQPTVVIGQWNCPVSTDAGTADASAVPGADGPIAIPWSTGFENRFCDFTEPAGFCTQPVEYSVVTSPTKNGHFSAAFTVLGEDGGASQQSRCVRQGVLPLEAYYGAWYYFPAAANNYDLWNLFHIRGNDPATTAGIVDVSVVNAPTGELNLVLYRFPRGDLGVVKTASVVVPIGSWFHIELYLRRANDNTGTVILYQDGMRVLDIAGMTDTDPMGVAQWYVGNLATNLMPPESTLYVDDVTIASTLGWTAPP